MTKRREFIKKSLIYSLGASSLGYFGCEEPEDEPGEIFNPSPDEDKPTLPSNTGNSNTRNSFDDYMPKINKAYKEPEYFRESEYSKEKSGNVDFYDPVDKDMRNFYIEDKNHKALSNLEAIFFKDRKFKQDILYVIDPNLNYYPKIVDVSNVDVDGGLKSYPGFIRMFSTEEKGTRIKGKDIFVNEIESGLPTWDLENMCERPGMVYLGDWSFNEIKQFNTNMNRASGIITLVAPNPASGAVYSVTSLTGTVLGALDFVIDFANIFNKIDIDKDKETPYFAPPFADGTMTFLLAVGEASYCASRYEEDIKDLIPTAPGNSWKYSNGTTIINKGLDNVKGKNVLIIDSGGFEEYYGFNGDKLINIGFNDSNVGRMFFDPGIVVGDSKIREGKKFSNSSKIISEKYPELSGTINEKLTCSGRETVIANNSPYGDCFRFDEEVQISIKNNKTGSTSNDSSEGKYWLAKNVGKVKQRLEGNNYELESFNFRGLKSQRINKSLFSPREKISKLVQAVL